MNKEEVGETKKKAKLAKKEEVQDDGAARVWTCKKTDGRRWHCSRPVSQPDTLCEYHFVQKRSYLNPDFEFQSVAELEETAPAPVPVPAAASKSTGNSSSKPRKKKKKPGNDCSATEGFYYYAGFGPIFRSKRRCRSSAGMNEPAKQEEEEETQTPEDASHPTDEAPEVAEFTNQQDACQEVSGCDSDIAGIAGVDEVSSDDDYDGIGIAGWNKDGTVDPQASIGELGKRKAPWKRWKKPVKARSLKSLM